MQKKPFYNIWKPLIDAIDRYYKKNPIDTSTMTFTHSHKEEIEIYAKDKGINLDTKEPIRSDESL